MARFMPLTWLALLSAGATATAQVPAAPEIEVDTHPGSIDMRPAIASDSRGNFVVVWRGLDGAGGGVFAQRFDSVGERLGANFLVNGSTFFGQDDPDVAMDRSGDFIVTWWSDTPSASSDVFARRYDRSATAVGGELRVNSFTTGVQYLPAVAADPTGNFVVAWTSRGQDGDGSGVFAQRFDAGGSAVGDEFQVNSATIGNQYHADVAVRDDGRFAIVWHGPGPQGPGVYVRGYAADGSTIGSALRVSPGGSGQYRSSITAHPEGYLVVWAAPDGGDNGIFGRRIDAGGSPVGVEFRVNVATTYWQERPQVAAGANGSFVVTWDASLSLTATQAYGRRFDSSGTPRGSEFLLSDGTGGHRFEPVPTVDSAGNFVAAWTTPQEPTRDGIAARRFQGILPAALTVDVLGNRVLEVGETAHVTPSWRNGTVVPQTFAASLASFSGPPGATYSIVDASAFYPETLPGSTVTCAGDDYAVAVSAAVRPSVHWDGIAVEDLGGPSTATEGLQKRWALHIGDSFGDVPRASPFYRLVETLLHNDVTGGCGGTQYCPAASTTREQMAVFVLVAKEGSGYALPACTPPNLFGDVPEGSPFCRWIEELATRGVVGGCGGGNYCPSDAVTREQMAVFVLRTLDPALDPPACTSPVFADVPAASVFCRWIEELARRGVVSGCGGGNYCPAEAVTREQMGVFISLTFGLSLYGP